MNTKKAALDLEKVEVEVMRLVEAGDVASAVSYLNASGDAVNVSRCYANLAQKLYGVGKDLSAMLAIAGAGVSFCFESAERSDSNDLEFTQTMKNSAKVLAFNAAANCWPGWGDEGIQIEERHLTKALQLAEQSMEIVRTLDLGNDQLGNAYWLLGALSLAMGRLDEAADAFVRSRDSFRTENSVAAELMAQGYLVITHKRDGRGDGEQSSEFSEVLRQLEQIGSKDASAYLEQLIVADRVLQQ